MARGRQTEDSEPKPPKPKEQFRIVLHVYDDGFVDKDLTEFYTLEETGRRKKIIHDAPSDFNAAIKGELAEDTNKLACWVLEAMGINPNAFANYVNPGRKSLPEPTQEQKDFFDLEGENEPEVDEDFLDPVTGEKP